MSQLNGKWYMTHDEELETFHKAIKTSDEWKVKLRDISSTVKIAPEHYCEAFKYNKWNNKLRRQCFLDGKKVRELESPCGVYHDAETAEGRPYKMAIMVKSDNKIVRYEKFPDFKAKSTFVADGDTLTVTRRIRRTAGEGSIAKLHYKRIN